MLSGRDQRQPEPGFPIGVPVLQLRAARTATGPADNSADHEGGRLGGVPLDVDTCCAFRSPQALIALVKAVLNARESDESDWIEWKSGLDLAAKGTWGTIARHVLGMATRRPGDAARCAEGCGYVIVGVAPGNCSGVAEVDPAEIGSGVQSYLGSDGPRWGMQYVNLDETPVLVTTAEPPRAGDRIFTLQKEFPGYRAGTVFVRKHGQTVQADPGDVRALEDRFAAVAAEVASRTGLIRDLKEAGALIERIATLASDPANEGIWWGKKNWRCEEQNILALVLTGVSVSLPMPSCQSVVGESGAPAVLVAVRQAREEVRAALKDLVQDGQR